MGPLANQELQDYFSHYGDVLEVMVDDGKFGAVRFASHDGVERALEDGSPVWGLSWECKHDVNGQMIACSRSQMVRTLG